MNRGRFKGNWKQARGEIKKQRGDLTDDDLDAMDGSETNSIYPHPGRSPKIASACLRIDQRVGPAEQPGTKSYVFSVTR